MQDSLHKGKSRRKADPGGREGRNSKGESSGQHRMALWSTTVQEASRPAEARPQLAVQDQVHHRGQRDKDEQGGRGGRSLESESEGQRRMLPRANPIQGGTREPSAGSKTPAKERLRREKHRREEEGPIPPWKKDKASQKRANNKRRGERRHKVADKWAKVQQSQNAGPSESARRPGIEDRQEAAQPPEPGARERSRRPRDAGSEESRSSSKGR